MEREKLYNVGKSIFLDLPNVEQKKKYLITSKDVENWIEDFKVQIQRQDHV